MERGGGEKTKIILINTFVACEKIRFSSLFAAGDVSRETSSEAKSEENRIFSQAKYSTPCKIVITTLLLRFLFFGSGNTDWYLGYIYHLKIAIDTR